MTRNVDVVEERSTIIPLKGIQETDVKYVCACRAYMCYEGAHTYVWVVCLYYVSDLLHTAPPRTRLPKAAVPSTCAFDRCALHFGVKN